MFIHLKKNKKIYVTILLFIILLFILINKSNNKFLEKFDSSKYKDNITFNEKNYNLFLLNYKNLNENLDFKNIKRKNILPRVAHAGGGFKNETYTNSINALDHNKKDFLFFEIDFFVTDDNKVVCEHDYNNHLKSIESFNLYVERNKKYKQCDYISLNKWLNENPKKFIITDFKNENLKGLKFISENFDNYQNRFIPQIYHPNEYHQVRKLGFKNIIWTLYKYNKSNESILLFSKKMDLFAITMNPPRARSGLAKSLSDMNIKTYVHTINNVEDYYKYLNIYKVDQIYTDWIK